MTVDQALADYNIETILHNGERILLCRARRKADGLPVLLKQLRSDFPTAAELAQFKGEFELTREPTGDGALRSLALHQLNGSLTLVQEDFPGEPLSALLSGGLPLDTALNLTANLSRQLQHLHDAEIVHRNLTPASLLIDGDRSSLKIINFGLASALSREYQEINNPAALGADLHYLAPEQTGRMNCSVDSRCDHYALGVILYQLATGRLPFTGQDPLELAYAHLARRPQPPRQLCPDLPAPVEAIILKLLEKNPEDRYQTASGLAADLDICRQGLHSPDGLGDFPLGRQDRPGTLSLGHKLYGRDAAIATLMQVFEAASHGGRELLLIAGYSGIGKTALVREVYLPLTRARGYFAQGKFDQLQKNLPYSALVSAFSSLIRQLLTESEERLAGWRSRLQLCLGENGRLLTEVIPDLELLIGPQPEVEEVPPGEGQARFHHLFRQFIHSFCRQDHPLVLFLDDLQWIDAASLNLLQVLLEDDEASYLLIIGAYRENEVDGTHPLQLTLNDLQQRPIQLRKLSLAPLQTEHISELLADSLAAPLAEVAPLTELLLRKTGGNPFFLLQFLDRLKTEELLRFVAAKGRWHWDLEGINALTITDNIVTLMVDKLNRLPAATRQVLQLAGCIGNSFDLETLAIIHQKSREESFADLLPAIQQELVVTTSGFEVTHEDLHLAELVVLNFRFLHDRIQQAAYSLIDPAQRRQVHLQIGRRLLAGSTENVRQERIFAIADHLNAGRELLTAPGDRLELARVNLAAARRAKEATAYRAALGYLQAGMERLPEGLWQDHYALALALTKLRAEVEHLNGRFDASEELLRAAAEQVENPVDKADLLHVLIVQYTLAARYPEAIDLAGEALGMLGIDLPADQFEVARDREMARVDLKLAGRSVPSLLELPPMTAPDKAVAMRILTAMGPPCYRSHQRLWAVIVAMEMNLLLAYGNVPAAAYTYTSYGGLLGFVRGEYGDCQAYAELALNLARNFHSSRDLSVAHLMIGASLDHWYRHLRHAEQSYQQAYQVGVDSGNLQYSAYAFGHQMYCRFFRSMPLDEQLQSLPDYLAFSRSRKNQWGIDLKLGVLMVLGNLVGRSGDRYSFHGGSESEADYLERCHRQRNVQVLCVYHLLKAYALYLHDALEEAAQSLAVAAEHLASVATQGLLPSAEFCFVESLLLSARFPHRPARDRQQILRQLQSHLARLRQWAEGCPENFLHKQLLVEAELSALENRPFEADQLYVQAAEEAGRQGFIQHQALAWERAARLWVNADRENFSSYYLQKARHAYQLWGAQRKLALLEQQRRQLVESDEVPAPPEIAPDLDLKALFKASQAISGQFRYRDLVTTLLEIVLERAGAEKTFLVRPLEKKLQLVAGIDRSQATQILQEPLPVEQVAGLSPAVVHYVARTHEQVALDHACDSELFGNCSYIQTFRPLSVVCLPLLNRGALIGVLYLENNLTSSAFNDAHLQILQVLAGQAAISLENASFYALLEERVEARTAELHLANTELQDSEQRQRQLFEAMVQPMSLHEIVCDPDGAPVDYRVLAVNPAFERLHGRPRQEVIGRSGRELFPDTAPERVQVYGAVALSGESAHFEEYDARLERHFDIVAYSPQPGQFVIIATDTTEKVHFEENRKRLEEQIFHTQKLESLGVLAGGIAHDFNNTLMAVMGHCELARRRLPKESPAMANLRQIKTATSKATELANQMLAYSGRGKFVVEPLGLNQIIEEIEHMLSVSISKKAVLRYELAPYLPAIEADATQISQVIMNLVINASDAIGEQSGVISLSTGAMDCDSGYLRETWINDELEAGQYIYLEVADTGCGMEQETINRIFEPFFSTKFTGRGLGMAAVLGIVRGHRGAIKVYSEPGKGSVFKVLFPASSAVASPVLDQEELVALEGGGLVLLVDDDETVRSIGREMLEELGFQVRVACEGRQALEVFSELRDGIDFVLMDLTMPHMDGEQAFREMRRVDPEVRVILSSGYNEQEVSQKFIGKGLAGFLKKPYQLPELQKAILSLRQAGAG